MKTTFLINSQKTHLHINKNPNKWIGTIQFISISIPNTILPKIAPSRPEVAVIAKATALKLYRVLRNVLAK